VEDNMEFKEIDILLQMEAIKCEREGMIADNKMKEYNHWSITYTYTDFMRLAGQIEELRDILRR
jgi:hypothetical protein